MSPAANGGNGTLALLTHPDPRFTWAVVLDLLDVLELAGFKRSDDDLKTGRAIELLAEAAALYSGGKP